ncbi:MAG: AbrB/MazE/SpoVT family DNA-binding domain-containing protein [Actinomycetia bacterium]|nr:AbrB/MazE/SpoVT family DNA-binding domain-containing protein [Actinomycetes bacterium]
MIATATVTSKGQVTIPARIRRQFGFDQGVQVVFVEEAGRLYVENAVGLSFSRLQEAMAGEAERVGLEPEADVVEMVKEIRRERGEAVRAGHA